MDDKEIKITFYMNKNKSSINAKIYINGFFKLVTISDLLRRDNSIDKGHVTCFLTRGILEELIKEFNIPDVSWTRAVDYQGQVKLTDVE